MPTDPDDSVESGSGKKRTMETDQIMCRVKLMRAVADLSEGAHQRPIAGRKVKLPLS